MAAMKAKEKEMKEEKEAERQVRATIILPPPAINNSHPLSGFGLTATDVLVF